MEEFIKRNKILINILEKEIKNKYYKKSKPGRKLVYKLRHILSAILYVCKTGVQWRFLYYKNIKWATVYKHFIKWSNGGIFYKCWQNILKIYQNKHKYKHNLKHLSIDCSFIKSIFGIDKVGKNSTDRGRKASKLSIIVDLIGTPIGYLLSAGNVNDSVLMKDTIKNIQLKRKRKANLYADKGYSSNIAKNIANEHNFNLLAPNKRNFKEQIFDAKKEYLITNHRYVVEATFSWIKSYKRNILRYDKSSTHFESFLLMAMSCLTNKKINNR